MDERVNCMACLVADESGMTIGAVVTVGVVTHALAKVADSRGTSYHLCAFDASGTLRPGTYWDARAKEEDIIRACEKRAVSSDGRGPDPTESAH